MSCFEGGVGDIAEWVGEGGWVRRDGVGMLVWVERGWGGGVG